MSKSTKKNNKIKNTNNNYYDLIDFKNSISNTIEVDVQNKLEQIKLETEFYKLKFEYYKKQTNNDLYQEIYNDIVDNTFASEINGIQASEEKQNDIENLELDDEKNFYEGYEEDNSEFEEEEDFFYDYDKRLRQKIKMKKSVQKSVQNFENLDNSDPILLLNKTNDFSNFWKSINTFTTYSHYKHLLNFSQYDKNGHTHLSYLLENYKQNSGVENILYDVIEQTNPNLLNNKKENLIMMLNLLADISDFFSNSLFKEIFLKKLYDTNLIHYTPNNENTFSFIIKKIHNYSSILKTSDWHHLIDRSYLHLNIKDDKYKYLQLETSILELMLANRNFLGSEFDPKILQKIIQQTNFESFSDPNRFIKKFFELGSFHLLNIPNSEHILEILKKSDWNKINNDNKDILSLAFKSQAAELLDEKCWNYLLENTDLKSINNTFLFDFFRSNYHQTQFVNFKEKQLTYLLENSFLYSTNEDTQENVSFLILYLQSNLQGISKLKLTENQFKYVIENTDLSIKNLKESSFYSLFNILHDISSCNIHKNSLDSIIKSLEKFKTKLNFDDLSVFFKYFHQNKISNNEISHNIFNKILSHYDFTNLSTLSKEQQQLNILSIFKQFSVYNFPDNLYAIFIKKLPIEFQKNHLDIFHDFQKISFLNPLVLHDLNVCKKLIEIHPNNFKYIGKHVIEYLELTKDNSLDKLSNLRSKNFWGYFKNKETDKLQEKIFTSIKYTLKSKINFNDFYENQSNFLDTLSLFNNENHQIRNKVKELEFAGIQYLTDFDNITLKKLLEDSYLKNLDLYNKISINDEANANLKLVIDNVNFKLDEFMSKIQENLILELKKESAIINFELNKI